MTIVEWIQSLGVLETLVFGAVGGVWLVMPFVVLRAINVQEKQNAQIIALLHQIRHRD